MKTIALLALIALLAVFTGCQSTKPKFAEVPGTPAPAGPAQPVAETVILTNQLDPALLQPATNLFTLGPGDRLEIELIGEPLSKANTVVAPDGKLYYSLLPGIDVWGLTLAEAKEKIEKAFTDFIRERPRVSLTLRSVESKRVWVLGRVQTPGVYSMATPMTLLEGISMAGGTVSITGFTDQSAAGIGEEMADVKRSFVIRQGKLMPVDFKRLLMEGDLTQNIYLQPDDFIYFPAATAREIYVLGAVTQPQIVPYSDGMTVAGAIASAYGTLKDAYTPHVAVVRGSLSQPQITIVNYRQVIRGGAQDIELQPHDIVYVPFSPYRYLKHYAEMVVNSFVSASAINAGSHAVIKQPQPGTGVFIPVGSGIQIIPPASVPPVR